MKKFIKKFIGFSLGPVIGAAISFFTVPITTFFINPTEFGKASMFTVIQSLVVSIIYVGIDQSYTREYHLNNDKINTFQNAIILPLFLSLVFLVGTIIFQDSFSMILFSSEEYSYISILFGIMIVSSVIERFILLSIRMSEDALEYSLFSIILKILVFLFTLLLIFSRSRDFLTVVYANIFGQLFGDFILLLRYKRLFKFKTNFINKKLLKSMVTFGFPLIIAASFSNLLNTSGRFFLRGYSTFYELGIYTAALKISNVLQIIQTAFTSFWVPTAYRWHGEDKDMKHFSFISDVLLLVMTVGFFFILFFKKYIVLILSSDYSDAQYVTGLLALTPILYTISETTTLGIVFSGKSFYNVYVSALSLIPNVLLNFLLVPKLGTIGAGIANACAYIVFCISRTYFSRKLGFKIKFSKQVISIFIFFIAACLNTIQSAYVFYGTLLLLVIVLLVQVSTFKEILSVINKKEDWNFE